ncbi:hypothetical protein CHS0354_027670 [Potamilus streckersoni]|uniref:Uncharacterized protein n=1 Tax=Potamilus streckersoni TaxID=2493646 RepID=A0AAE0W496_9BIVA|nr:hypothetical protein CHS0354_027670 [Potamilus streckersoni]
MSRQNKIIKCEVVEQQNILKQASFIGINDAVADQEKHRRLSEGTKCNKTSIVQWKAIKRTPTTVTGKVTSKETRIGRMYIGKTLGIIYAYWTITLRFWRRAQLTISPPRRL